MATLAGQRTQFTWALNQYNTTDDPDEKEKFVRRMAKYIANAPLHGFTVDEVTQKQSYPASDVEKFLREGIVLEEPEISEQVAIKSLEEKVDVSDVINKGTGEGTVYAYGYRCAPDRLKIGCTDSNAIQRIAAQIFTSTPDKPVLFIDIKTNACRALERAIHGILQTRGRKIKGGGDEWFITTREEILDIYEFIKKSA